MMVVAMFSHSHKAEIGIQAMATLPGGQGHNVRWDNFLHTMAWIKTSPQNKNSAMQERCWIQASLPKEQSNAHLKHLNIFLCNDNFACATSDSLYDIKCEEGDHGLRKTDS